MRVFIYLILLSPLLVACATQPSSLGDADVSSIDVVTARNAPESVKGSRVRWGGTIVNVENRKHETRVEILSRPLYRGGEPDDRKDGLGRFTAVIPGFLDAADYKAPNRMTVVGVLDGVKSGRVGESRYTFPVVRVEHHQMWRGERRDVNYYDSHPRFWWGLGAHSGNGSIYWGGYPSYWW